MREATVLVAFLGLVLAALWLLAGQDIDLPALRDRLATLGAIQQDNPLTVAALFFAAYVAVTALSLPIAVWLTLAGGALFGFWTGLALVSFASAVGATLAFLASRYVLRDWVRARLGSRAEKIEVRACAGWGFLSLLAATYPGRAVLCREPADGADAGPGLDLLLG